MTYPDTRRAARRAARPTLPRSIAPLAAAVLACAAMGAAHAQQTTPSGGMTGRSGMGYSSTEGYSWLPYTRNGYWSVNVGRGDFSTGCGALNCDNPDISGKVATGGLINNVVGLELGYVNFGRADRGGGQARAQGLNLSLVGRLPVTSGFSVFAKGGATYARTKITADPTTGVTNGTATGWGGSFGGGLSYDFTPRQSVVLEWERHNLQFAGGGRQGVKMTSIGYLQRF